MNRAEELRAEVNILVSHFRRKVARADDIDRLIRAVQAADAETVREHYGNCPQATLIDPDYFSGSRPDTYEEG